MTTQHVRRLPVTIDDPRVYDQVRTAVDELDVIDASRHAVSLGIAPPTGEAGWYLVQRFEADGSGGPIMWVHVIEIEDEDQD